MTPERIEELVRQGLAFDAVSDPRGQVEMTIRQAIKEASLSTEDGSKHRVHKLCPLCHV